MLRPAIAVLERKKLGKSMQSLPNGAPRLAPSRYIGYGLGDFAFNFYWKPLQVFLLLYYTDVLGLSGNAAGLIIMICLVWDGLIDPVIGVIANKTRSRFGRYRPYMLFGCVPLALSFAFMFFPVSFTGQALFVYALATQMLFRTMYAAVNIPYGAMMASMTRDSMERNWLAGVRMLFAFSGSAIVGYYTPRLVRYFGETNGDSAYFISTAVMSACAVVVTLVSFALTEERVAIENHRKGVVEAYPSVGQMIKMIASNKPFMLVMGGIALFAFGDVAVNASLAYYVQYYMGLDLTVTGNLVGMMPLVQMIFILPWTVASKYLGKRWAWISGLGIAAASLAVLFAIDRPSLTMIYVLLAIFSAGSASIAVNFWSIVPDTVEYGEWRTGVRAEGFIFGFVTLVQKVALGIASAFVGSYLVWIGYVANQDQTEATLYGLKLLITVVASLGLLASCVVMYFYKLSAAKHAELVREIAARQGVTA